MTSRPGSPAADAVVGTSAGALVGALLASGRDVTDAFISLGALAKAIDGDVLPLHRDRCRER